MLKKYVTVTVAEGVEEHAHLYRFADRRRRHLCRSRGRPLEISGVSCGRVLDFCGAPLKLASRARTAQW